MIAYLALGGNMPSHLGDPAATIAAALAELSARGAGVIATSGLYNTPCFPAGAGPDFVNAACAVAFDGGPHELLALCHEVEADLGRVRKGRWQARSIDIDLIAMGDMILPDIAGYRGWLDLDPDLQKSRAPDQLILPHPRLQDRAFVLIPMSDIAPDWEHPVLRRTVKEMVETLPQAEKDAVRPVSQGK